MNAKSNQSPNNRQPATDVEVRQIAAAILAYRDASAIVSRVLLTDRQRRLISRAHETAMLHRRQRTPKVEYVPSGPPRFLQGGAPGLVQQRIRRF